MFGGRSSRTPPCDTKYHFMRTELITTLKRKASELLADIEKDGAPHHVARLAGCLPRRSVQLLTTLCAVILSSQLQAAASMDLPGATTVSNTDLTEPFHTKTKWQFVIRQDPPDQFEVPGLLHFCFVKDGTPDCSDRQHNALIESVIIHPTPT